MHRRSELLEDIDKAVKRTKLAIEEAENDKQSHLANDANIKMVVVDIKTLRLLMETSKAYLILCNLNKEETAEK